MVLPLFWVPSFGKTVPRYMSGLPSMKSEDFTLKMNQDVESTPLRILIVDDCQTVIISNLATDMSLVLHNSTDTLSFSHSAQVHTHPTHVPVGEEDRTASFRDARLHCR